MKMEEDYESGTHLSERMANLRYVPPIKLCTEKSPSPVPANTAAQMLLTCEKLK